MNRVKDFFVRAGWMVLPFLVVAIIWETLARSGIYPPKLFPSLVTVFEALVRLVVSGALWTNTQGTLVRLVLGFALAGVVGVLLGIAMGRYRVVEDVFLPIVSIGYPIPGLAYAPLFVLWFGLGDLPAVLLVGLASSFSVTINTWKGVKAVREIWLRAAQAMGANDRQIFLQVSLPGALPYIFTGLRLGLAVVVDGCEWQFRSVGRVERQRVALQRIVRNPLSQRGAHLEQHPLVADGHVRGLIADDRVAFVVVGGANKQTFDGHDLWNAGLRNLDLRLLFLHPRRDW